MDNIEIIIVDDASTDNSHEECRNILEDIYQFELKDFYQMNAQTRDFDNALIYTINQQEELLKQYDKLN